jgi:hypothetical protein
VDAVVQQHADEACSCRARRTAWPISGRDAADLRRLDDRIAAHLDRLSVAGEHAWPFCDDALEASSRGSVFTAAVQAIESGIGSGSSSSCHVWLSYRGRGMS